MDLTFHPISRFQRGTLYHLLCDAYAYNEKYRRLDAAAWQEADNFFFDNPEIADGCGFVTVLENETVGFACWDPRNLPAYAEIGHNCLLQEAKGRGYGKIQLREVIRRVIKRSPEKIIVTTNTDLVPAQRMYEAAGFTAVHTWKGEYFEHIDYELYPNATIKTG